MRHPWPTMTRLSSLLPRPTTVAPNATSVLTITLTNTNASAITGAAFTDTYPANLVNTAAASGATTSGS